MLCISLLLLLFALIQIGGANIGCISDVIFISTDIIVSYNNQTITQCQCFLSSQNYSGFNYYSTNKTCELFINFTSAFQLNPIMQTQFCFLNGPPSRALYTTKSIQTSHVTSTTTTTLCPSTTTFQTTCVHYLALKLSTDPCLVINITQTSNPLTTIGFSASVTKLVGSSSTSTADGCTAGGSYVGGSVTGRIALVRRGSCLFYTKSINAESAGASAVVIFNSVAGIVIPLINGTPPVTIPVVSISADDGARVSSAIDASSSTLPVLSLINATNNC